MLKLEKIKKDISDKQYKIEILSNLLENVQDPSTYSAIISIVNINMRDAVASPQNTRTIILRMIEQLERDIYELNKEL